MKKFKYWFNMYFLISFALFDLFITKHCFELTIFHYNGRALFKIDYAYKTMLEFNLLFFKFEFDNIKDKNGNRNS